MFSFNLQFLSCFSTLATDEIRNAASHLVLTYSADFDACIENEVIQFSDLSKSFAHEQTNETSKELFLYRLIITKGLKETFPNVEIAFRIYLVLMVSNCSSERSFSKLKLIKNGSERQC